MITEGRKERNVAVGDELKCTDLQTSPSLASCLLLLKVNGKLISGSINGRLLEKSWLLIYLVKTQETTYSLRSKVSPGKRDSVHPKDS